MERKFWNHKYEMGGLSGRGSIGVYRNWKWLQILGTCGKNIHSVIDVGCGDLTFWNHPIAAGIMRKANFNYLGIDISDHIIKRNRKAFPHLRFVNAPSHEWIPSASASLVLGLDLLFHIHDDAAFEVTLENLCNYTNMRLAIYTWYKNPFTLQNRTDDGISQWFRPLGKYAHIFSRNDLRMIFSRKVPFDPFGKMYIFEKVLY